MNSIVFLRNLDLIKRSVIQDCKEAIESIASERYPVDNGYKKIIITFPLYDSDLCTPIYVNSCFDGEENILIRRITCSPDGISVGCHYIGEGQHWKANIADACMHERDMINILALIERMKCVGNVFEHLHVSI